MDVAVERFLPPIGDLHRTPGLERQQAGVNVHAQVLPGAERTAHATEVEANFLAREVETGRNLFLVDVQPLGSDI